MIRGATITQKEFELFRNYIYNQVGISLSPHKLSLVQGRLAKRLKALDLNSYKAYYDYMVNDPTGEEESHLISAISTNVTTFFRESRHWEFLEEYLPTLLAKKEDRKLRIWSAASSSGEEPYSLAIFMLDHIPNADSWDIKILATDISQRVLKKAVRGVYEARDVAGLSQKMLNNHFVEQYIDEERYFEVSDKLKSMVMYRSFNLVHDSFELFRNNFDIIFCRNVMIYFDPQTQQALVSKFHKILPTGGLLFVGHSESLTRNKNEFKLIIPSVYKKI